MKYSAPADRLLSVVAFLACAGLSQAGALDLQKLEVGVYAVIGPLGNRCPEYLGDSATFGLVVADEGVVLIVIDPGGP